MSPDLRNQCCRARGGHSAGCHSNEPPCTKKHVFCLPCGKHFIHQKSLREGGITLKHLKSLLLSPPWARQLNGWEHSRLNSGKGVLEQAQALQTGAFGTISSHLGPYKSSGAVNSGLLICIHASDGLFFFPLEAKGRKGNVEIEQGSFSAGVSLSCSRRNSSLTPINSSRGSADFKWNIKSHWDRNNSFMSTSVLNTIKFWAWTPARSFQK